MREKHILGIRHVCLRDSLYIVFVGLILVGLVRQATPVVGQVYAYTKSLIPQVPKQAVLIASAQEKKEEIELIEDFTPSEDWEGFKDSARKIASIYNFPAKVVIAQAALESQRGTSNLAVTRKNFLGIGAYDWNPNEAFTYENKEQCLIEYMNTIRKNFPEAWDSRDNPEKLLHLLVKNSNGNYYASDPRYVQKVTSMKEWGQE